MIKRLKDFNAEDRKTRPIHKAQVLPMHFGDDDASKRIVTHSAKRVIRQHKDEIQELAYK